MRAAPALFVGVIGGFVLGVMVVQAGPAALTPTPTRSSLGEIISERLKEAEQTPIRCGVEVDTEGWKTFRDVDDYAVEFKYPPGFAVEKRKGELFIHPLDSQTTQTITIEKIRGAVVDEMDEAMQFASWKIADRKTYALASPFLTDEDTGELWMKYVFVRDFPLYGGANRYVIVRAVIRSPLSQSEYETARARGTVDYENILTTPEQILATFRFLQYAEIPEEKRWN